MSKKLSDLIGQFATIPNTFITQSVELTTEAKWLFVILRYHTNSKTGNAFPSYTKIQEITGFHRKTIAKSLKELGAAGWLTKQRRFGATTLYALQFPSSSLSDTTEEHSSSLNSTISSSISATISSSHGVHTNQTEEEARLKEPDRGEERCDLLAEFKSKSPYSRLDVDSEFQKATVWADANHRVVNKRMFVNWLNRALENLPLNGNGAAKPLHDEAFYVRQEELARRMGRVYIRPDSA